MFNYLCHPVARSSRWVETRPYHSPLYNPVLVDSHLLCQAEVANLTYYWRTRRRQQLAEFYPSVGTLRRKLLSYRHAFWAGNNLNLRSCNIAAWAHSYWLIQGTQIFLSFELLLASNGMHLNLASERQGGVRGMYGRKYKVYLRAQRQECSCVSCGTAVGS